MYIYLIKRTDKIQYDEYAGAVIIAQNEIEAWEIAQKELYPCFTKDRKNIDIKLIGESLSTLQKGVVLDDFNAG